MNNDKILIAYFSCSGTTRAAAEKLAQVTGGDLYEIRPQVPYTAADLNWHDRSSRSSVEMRDPTSRPAIAAPLADLRPYGTLFVGFPVWWYVAPTIINTFLESGDLSGKRVIPFATSGGSSIDNCEKHLRAAYPAASWSPGRLLNSASTDQIARWIAQLGLSAK